MKIDFVSDVACPWCAIGLASLEQAIARLGGEVPVELHLQPFELNPGMPAEGEAVDDYIRRKYGTPADEWAARRAVIRQRAAEVGLRFGERSRVWNTFAAHRLLHWAGLEGRQRELKRALLAAYHEQGENPGAREVLVRAAAEVGLDAERAGEVFDRGEFADEVRASVAHWQSLGIHAVPSAIVDDRYLIQGGQPVEAYERALREIAATPATN